MFVNALYIQKKNKIVSNEKEDAVVEQVISGFWNPNLSNNSIL